MVTGPGFLSGPFLLKKIFKNSLNNICLVTFKLLYCITKAKNMTQVTHKIFGTGTVTINDAKTVTVNFNGEVKTLVIKFANLTNEDGIAWTAPKVKKATVKSDLSAYSDSELKAIYAKEKSEFVSGICDANKEAKAEGKKGFGFIN